MNEREFFEYLNWFLFFVWEFLAGAYLGYLYDEGKNDAKTIS